MRSPNGRRHCFGAGHSSSDIGLSGRCCIQDAGTTPVASTRNRRLPPPTGTQPATRERIPRQSGRNSDGLHLPCLPARRRLRPGRRACHLPRSVSTIALPPRQICALPIPRGQLQMVTCRRVRAQIIHICTCYYHAFIDRGWSFSPKPTRPRARPRGAAPWGRPCQRFGCWGPDRRSRSIALSAKAMARCRVSRIDPIRTSTDRPSISRRERTTN